jgi:YVTN family beta-propeller protein
MSTVRTSVRSCGARARWSRARAVDLVSQLAHALDAAHAHGLVHGDVKPSNALIAMEGAAEHVYLADFGLTRSVADGGGTTANEQLVGTVDYLAPECLAGQAADGRADIYALGCVLYAALTGEVPFPRDSDVETIYAHLEDEPPCPSQRHAGVPVAFDAVIARALAKDPERRFQSGAELAAAAHTAVSRPADLTRRRARVQLAGGVVAALAVAFLVVRLVGGSSGGGLATADADAVAVIDPGKHSLLADIPVGSSPAQVAEGAGALWVANEAGGTVSRIDRRTRAVSQTISVGNGPTAVAVGAGGVWVANSLDGTLKWISPATNEVVKTISAGDSPSGVCVAGGAVWVASTYDSSIVRYDPLRGHRTAIALRDRPAQLACGGGSVWAASPSSGTVTQVSAQGQGAVVRRIRVGRTPDGLAWGDGALWVTSAEDGTVSRINGRSGTRTALIGLGRQSGPAGVAVSGGGVWVANERAGTVARIDPARNAVAETLKTGNHPQSLAVVDGALWVSVRASGVRHRGGRCASCTSRRSTGSDRPHILWIRRTPTTDGEPCRSPTTASSHSGAWAADSRARSCPISRCLCRRRPAAAGPTPSGCAAGCATRPAPRCTRPTSGADWSACCACTSVSSCTTPGSEVPGAARCGGSPVTCPQACGWTTPPARSPSA